MSTKTMPRRRKCPECGKPKTLVATHYLSSIAVTVSACAACFHARAGAAQEEAREYARLAEELDILEDDESGIIGPAEVRMSARLAELDACDDQYDIYER